MLSNFQLFGSSVQYIPIAILIFIYAALLRKSEQNLSHGLFVGATILCVSIFVRTIDEPMCQVVSTGTHFGWHILNAVMLSWMIEVLRRHMLAGHLIGR